MPNSIIDFNNYIKGELSENKVELLTYEVLEVGFDSIQRERLEKKLLEDYGISSVDSPNPKKKQYNIRQLYGILAIAATILFLLVSGTILYTPESPSKENLMVTYLSEKISNPTIRKGNHQGNDFSKYRTMAIDAYNQNDYKVAIDAYGQLFQQKDLNIDDYFFFGLSHLYRRQPEEAIPLFLKAQQLSNKYFQEEITWFLGLAYIDLKQPEKAIVYLKQSTQQSWKSEEAKALLESMN